MQHHKAFLWMQGIECQSRNSSLCALFDTRMSNRPLIKIAGSGSSEGTISRMVSGPARRPPAQPVQVLPLDAVEPERAGHRVKDLRAGVNLPALLEPGVPGDAHAGQERGLFAAQPGRAPPRTPRQAEVTGAEPGAARLQELAKLRPPLFAGPPRRPVRSFVRAQGLFPSPNVPHPNLAVSSELAGVPATAGVRHRLGTPAAVGVNSSRRVSSVCPLAPRTPSISP